MKIICDCENEVNIPIDINNEEGHYKLKNKDKKNIDFTHVYNGKAAIICNKCGRKITWF